MTKFSFPVRPVNDDAHWWWTTFVQTECNELDPRVQAVEFGVLKERIRHERRKHQLLRFKDGSMLSMYQTKGQLLIEVIGTEGLDNMFYDQSELVRTMQARRMVRWFAQTRLQEEISWLDQLQRICLEIDNESNQTD